MAQKVKAFPLFNLLPYKSSGWLLNHGDFYSALSSYSRQLADVNGDAHADIIDFAYDKTLQIQKTLEAIKPEIDAKEVLVYAIDEVHLLERDLINHLWVSSQ